MSTSNDINSISENNSGESTHQAQEPWRTRLWTRISTAGGSNDDRNFIQSIFEIVFITAWALFFARDYLDFSPNVWPLGREFGMAIQTHLIWTLLPYCGDCVLWNGFINGGSPAFAELHGAILHPVVILPTIIWGGLNGAKAAVIGSIALAGIAQWLLAKTMKLGLFARLWAGMMAVVGGHLAGKMEIGVAGMVISTAAASLVIASGVNLGLTGRRRSALLFGITLALAIVSGQGYIQIGLALAIIPAFAVFIFDANLNPRAVWREYALGIVIALLLAGVFLVPTLHFWPNFGKDIFLDFEGTQTIGNSILNLVISDIDIYLNEGLGTLPYPYQYIIFVGWIPVVLAVLSLRMAPRRQNRLLLFFIIALVLVFMTSSALTLRWFARVIPDWAASIRIPSLVAGLAVPLVLGLAAWSVDLLLAKDWTLAIFESRQTSDDKQTISLNITWIVVGLLLILSIRTAFLFSRDWLATMEVDANEFKAIEMAESLNPAYSQWTEMVRGEHFWAPIAISKGLKLTYVTRPWNWKEHDIPEPRLLVTRDQTAENDPGYQSTFNSLYYVLNEDVHYAFVQTEAGDVPCEALALGGHIDVTCTGNEPGRLIIQEYYWPGWKAERDGNPADIEPGLWLNAEAPVGTHEFQFRYRPWDVYLGLALTIIGILLTIWLWIFNKESGENSASVPANHEIQDQE